MSNVALAHFACDKISANQWGVVPVSLVSINLGRNTVNTCKRNKCHDTLIIYFILNKFVSVNECNIACGGAVLLSSVCIPPYLCVFLIFCLLYICWIFTERIIVLRGNPMCAYCSASTGLSQLWIPQLPCSK